MTIRTRVQKLQRVCDERCPQCHGQGQETRITWVEPGQRRPVQSGESRRCPSCGKTTNMNEIFISWEQDETVPPRIAAGL